MKSEWSILNTVPLFLPDATKRTGRVARARVYRVFLAIVVLDGGFIFCGGTRNRGWRNKKCFKRYRFFFDSLFYLSILLKRIAIFFAMWIELVFEIVVLQSNLFKISRKYEYMNINMKIFIFLVRLNLRSYRSILSILINWIILFKKKSQAKN